MILEIRNDQQNRRNEHNHLGRAVTIETERSCNNRSIYIPWVLRPVDQVTVNKSRIKCGRKGSFEGCARVQKPGRGDRKQENYQPGKTAPEDLQHGQAHCHCRDHGDKDAGGAGDENGFSKNRERQHLQVNGCAQVILRTVHEIGGEEFVGIAGEIIPEKILRKDRLHRFIGKKVDREGIECDEPGDQINQHRTDEQPERGASAPGAAQLRAPAFKCDPTMLPFFCSSGGQCALSRALQELDHLPPHIRLGGWLYPRDFVDF